MGPPTVPSAHVDKRSRYPRGCHVDVDALPYVQNNQEGARSLAPYKQNGMTRHKYTLYLRKIRYIPISRATYIFINLFEGLTVSGAAKGRGGENSQ